MAGGTGEYAHDTVALNWNWYLFDFRRREAAQVYSVRKGVQSELEPDYTLAEAYGVQALCLRAVPQGIPTESGLATAQGDAAHGRARDAE